MSDPSDRRVTIGPPRGALALLRWRVPRADREFVIGDLVEAFETRAQRRGTRAARRWFWRESLAIGLKPWPATPTTGIPAAPKESLMQSFTQDLRFATRMIVRSPAVSVLTVLTLALGIGATSAIYSVARPALFDPPPYPDPDRLALVWERSREGTSNIGYATFRDLERESRTISAAAAMSYWQPAVSDGQETERLNGQRVTHRFFEVLGVRPLLGRFFDATEDIPEANTVAVLGYGLWLRRFGGDSGIVDGPSPSARLRTRSSACCRRPLRACLPRGRRSGRR
ncbi:MAG TPA: ABC transporter permease [Gemmatimonadaceae bacterium]